MAVQTSLLSRSAHNGTSIGSSNGSSNSFETSKASPTDEKSEETSQEPEVDIVINNVVASFNVRCHLNLRDIALRGLNVEYRRENGVRILRTFLSCPNLT